MTAAIPLLPINMFVGKGAPFHCTTEQGDKLLPFTVIATGGPVSGSTAAFEGEMELMAGAGRVVPVGGAASENLRELEFDAGVLPDTVMATAAASVPRKAVSAAVISAASCVELTRVVGRGEPFQLTLSPSAKPVPVTVRVRPVGLQNGVLLVEVVDAETDAMVAREIVNETEFEVFALDAGLATATVAGPCGGDIRRRYRRDQLGWIQLGWPNISRGQLRCGTADRPLHDGAWEKVRSGDGQGKSGGSGSRARLGKGNIRRRRRRPRGNREGERVREEPRNWRPEYLPHPGEAIPERESWPRAASS